MKVNTKLEKKTIWVDFLCPASLIAIWRLSREIPIEKVYYINVNLFLKPYIRLLSRICQKSFIQVTDIIEGEEKIYGISLHEYIQQRLIEIINDWIADEAILNQCLLFCKRYQFNLVKFQAHLKEAAYPFLMRPIEMAVLAQHQSGLANTLLLYRKTPLAKLLKRNLKTQDVYFYTTFVSQYFPIEHRPRYVYDAMLNRHYYTNRLTLSLKVIRLWLLACLNALSVRFQGINASDQRMTKSKCDFNIAVELTQSRIRLKEINDLFWIRDSNIDSATICGIEFENFDEESVRILQNLGIRRFNPNPFRRLRVTAQQRSSSWPSIFVAVDAGYGLRTLLAIGQLWQSLFLWDEKGWLILQQVNFICRTEFWLSIYRQLGIKMLWTMYDMDPDKLAKGQAIEKLGGLFVGGHWSNNPLYKVDNQKCFDVVFCWGPHFVKSNFSFYPYFEVFQVGHPSDHYFAEYYAWAIDLKAQYKGKLILSYHDNAMANDIPWSYGMNIRVHKLLIVLLKKYKELAVFLKPKRKYHFEEVLKEVPELQEFIHQGRIRVFFGETPRTKAVPAAVGLASDLALGLGVSTAATECFFAGTIAFHADLTGFVNNAFANQGLGTIVFRDLESLQQAIEDRIEGRNVWTHADYRKYYERLDPFQDGQTYRRMGFLMKKLQEGLQSGLSREETVAYARKEYEAFLGSHLLITANHR